MNCINKTNATENIKLRILEQKLRNDLAPRDLAILEELERLPEDAYFYVYANGELQKTSATEFWAKWAIGPEGFFPIIISPETGTWVVNGIDSGVPAQGLEGPAGKDGLTTAIKIGESIYEQVDGTITLPEPKEYLTRDNVEATPTSGSDNLVTSSGIYDALETKQDNLTFDEVPTENSDNPVKSGGIYNVLRPLVNKAKIIEHIDELPEAPDTNSSDLVGVNEELYFKTTTKEVDPSDEITNLKNCQWVGNVSLTTSTDTTFNLTFTSNNTTYSSLRYNNDWQGVHLYYDSLEAYGFLQWSAGWKAEAYKTIIITGGSDATNSTLIAWLKANGTLTRLDPTQFKYVQLEKVANKVTSISSSSTDAQYPSAKAVNDSLDTKVDKMYAANTVYGVVPNEENEGNVLQVGIYFDVNANPYTLAFRSADGSSDFYNIGIASGAGIAFHEDNASDTWLDINDVKKLNSLTYASWDLQADKLVLRGGDGSIQAKSIKINDLYWIDIGTDGELTYGRQTSSSDSDYALTTKGYVDNKLSTKADITYVDNTFDKLNIENGEGNGSVHQKNTIYDGENIEFDSGKHGTQNGDNIPGGDAKGIQSYAFGGLRYDCINADEDNWGRTATSVTGNQSMAVGGSVHVNGDWSFACCKDNETYQKLAFAAGGGNRVGQTEEEFNALWNWHLNENGQPIDSDNKTYDNSNSLSAVFGETNRVTRRAGFAAGSTNKVERDYSAAFGRNNEITAAGGTTQLVCGYYNRNNADDIFEIGNGSSSQRSNAFYVTKEGKAYVDKETDRYDLDNVLTTKGFTETRYLIKPTDAITNDSIVYQSSKGSNNWKIISDTAFWNNNVNSPKAWSAIMRNSAGKTEVATATSKDSKYTVANKEYVDNRVLDLTNGTTSFSAIKVGNTTLNEEQLKKLLALIEAMETVTVEE